MYSTAAFMIILAGNSLYKISTTYNLTSYIVNTMKAFFFYSRNVNSGDDKSVPTWPLYNVDHQLYNDFGSDITVQISPAKRAHQFWYREIPRASKSVNHSHDPGEL